MIKVKATKKFVTTPPQNHYWGFGMSDYYRLKKGFVIDLPESRELKQAFDSGMLIEVKNKKEPIEQQEDQKKEDQELKEPKKKGVK